MVRYRGRCESVLWVSVLPASMASVGVGDMEYEYHRIFGIITAREGSYHFSYPVYEFWTGPNIFVQSRWTSFMVVRTRHFSELTYPEPGRYRTRSANLLVLKNGTQEMAGGASKKS
jgi:hypothetical protein